MNVHYESRYSRTHIKSNALSLRNLWLEKGPLLQQSLSFMEESGELGYHFASTQVEWDWLVSCGDPRALAAQSLHSALLAHRGHYDIREWTLHECHGMMFHRCLIWPIRECEALLRFHNLGIITNTGEGKNRQDSDIE